VTKEVILERALASEGSHNQLVCSSMFLILIKGRVVKAEILHSQAPSE